MPQVKNAEISEIRKVILNLYNKTFFSGLKLRRRMLPMGNILLIFLLISFVVGMDPNNDSSRYLFSFLITVFIISFGSVFFIKKNNDITFKRILPDFVQAEDKFEYLIEVKNTGKKKSISFDAKDESIVNFPDIKSWFFYNPKILSKINFFDNWTGYPKWLWIMNRIRDVNTSTFTVPALNPNETILIKIKGYSCLSGTKMFLGISIGINTVFNLSRALFFIEQKDFLNVIPVPLDSKLKLPSGTSSDLPGEALINNSNLNDNEEFRGLKEWRDGDSYKKIDWKASAKLQKPIVKEFAPEFKIRSGIIINTFLPEICTVEHFNKLMGYVYGFIINNNFNDIKAELIITNEKIIDLNSALSSGNGYGYIGKLLSEINWLKENTLFNLNGGLINKKSFSTAVYFTIKYNEEDRAFIKELNDMGIKSVVFSLLDNDFIVKEF